MYVYICIYIYDFFYLKENFSNISILNVFACIISSEEI